MTDTTYPGHRGQTPVAILPCAVAANAARGKALALGFAERGWDICLLSGGAGVESCESVVEAVEAAGRRALVLDVAYAALATAAGADAAIARCEAVLGRPQCLVNTPFLVEAEEADSAGAGSEARTSAENRASVVRLTEANLATALALAHALRRVWASDAGTSGASGSSAASSASACGKNRDAITDVVVINLVDSGLFDMQAERLSFLLTQSGLHAATPALARAFAPRVRVVAIATPLQDTDFDVIGNRVTDPPHDPAAGSHLDARVPDNAHNTPVASQAPSVPVSPTTCTKRSRVSHAALSDAVCYLATSSNITGSTLLIDGGLRAGEPIADPAVAPVQPEPPPPR